MSRPAQQAPQRLVANQCARPFFTHLALIGVSVAAIPASAYAHTVGLAEQVLQPVSAVHTLLPLLATALILRQQNGMAITRTQAIALGAGLLAGFVAWNLIGQSPHWQVLTLTIAMALGTLAATGRTPATLNISWFVAALGVALGTNLLMEAHDPLDFTTSLAGAFIGSLAVLQIAVTLPSSTTGQWQGVGERIAGSWIVAIATMVVALEVRKFL